jgi:hypothetical protein
MRCWAYLEYQNGSLTHFVTDPTSVWQSNVVDGNVLLGRGEREYSTMAQFLSAIASRQQPVDMYWSFAKWNSPECRQAGIKSADTKIHWAIEVALGDANTQHIAHGMVPEFVESSLKVRHGR